MQFQSTYTNKPASVTGSQRQRMVARNGAVLERGIIFMPSQSWDSLNRLCKSQGRTASEVVQALVGLAGQYNQKGSNAERLPTK